VFEALSGAQIATTLTGRMDKLDVHDATDTERNQAHSTQTQGVKVTDSESTPEQHQEPHHSSFTRRLQLLEASEVAVKKFVDRVEEDKTKVLCNIDKWAVVLHEAVHKAAQHARLTALKDAAAQSSYYDGFMETVVKEMKVTIECKDVCDVTAYNPLPPRPQTFMGSMISLPCSIKEDCVLQQVPRFVQEKAKIMFDDFRVASNLKRITPRDAQRPPAPQILGNPDMDPSDQFPVILRLGITLKSVSDIYVMQSLLPWLASAVSASVRIKVASMMMPLTPVVFQTCPHRGELACAVGFPLDVPKAHVDCLLRTCFGGWEADRNMTYSWS
jgi:hypothetical protein